MKKVLITGGTSGLGKALALKFLSKGYSVLITYNNSEKEALDMVNSISNVKAVRCDLRDEKDIKNLFNYDVDLLINNAVLNHDDEILNKSKEDFMEVLEVNLVGSFLMCKEAIRHGIKNIINISSTDSVDTYNSLNIDYSSSKAGLNIVTKTIALAFSDVRIIGVLPNFMNTESVLSMSPIYLESELKRIGQEKLLDKDEVANKIYNIFVDNNIKSGDLIRIEE